jgi:hypothetical protein
MLAYAIAMAAGKFTGDWLAQRMSGKNLLHASGLLIAVGMGCSSDTVLVARCRRSDAYRCRDGKHRSCHLGSGRP